MKYDKNIISEDNHPKKIYVIFSTQIKQDIITIKNHNQENTEALSQWYDYIEGIKRWLSNPSIAWDYANRFAKFPNGSRYIRDFDYNIGYTVKTNQYGAYVYVFIINLKLQEFGLNIPPTIKENKIQNLHNTMKNKKVIRLTESDLHNIIAESVKQALNELDWKTYANYQRGRMSQAAQARANKDYENEKNYSMKAIQGGNAAGKTLRSKHGFDSIDDFNQTAQRSRNNMTLPQNNPKYQNYLNYMQDVNDYYGQ